jgi:N utilization substance protein B
LNEYEYGPINRPEDRPKGKFANRSLARIVAFQVLYQDDQNPGSAATFGEEFLREELPDHEPIRNFAQSLIDGTTQNKAKIDAMLKNTSENWAISRLSSTDHNILRLAIYEILFMETPRVIVINEAVELAKRFGTADSPGFVNGVLDKLRIDTL